MRKSVFIFLILAFGIVMLYGSVFAKDIMPEGWSKWVQDGNDSAYEIGVDTKIFRSEPKSYYIKSVTPVSIESSAQVVQAIQSDDYRGKRIRLSVFLRGENIKDRGWIYLQASTSKPIRGGADHCLVGDSPNWINCKIVMDVPQNSKNISYGINLKGGGQIWFDDLSIGVVGKDVPETWLYLREEATKPSNLP